MIPDDGCGGGGTTITCLSLVGFASSDGIL